jgi:hypothetical protein
MVASGVDLEALFFLGSLTFFVLGVAPWCLGLVQISLPDIVSLRGSQVGTRCSQDASSLSTRLSPVSS